MVFGDLECLRWGSSSRTMTDPLRAGREAAAAEPELRLLSSSPQACFSSWLPATRRRLQLIARTDLCKMRAPTLRGTHAAFRARNSGGRRVSGSGDLHFDRGMAERHLQDKRLTLNSKL